MDCCSTENVCEVSLQKELCFQCTNPGKKVGKITLFHILKSQYLQSIGNGQYYFCETRDCNIVYFCNETKQSFSKNQVRIRVGAKETGYPRHVCYCFDYTEQDIIDEIKRMGNSKVADEISVRIKENLCACEVKNPAGNCCLGQVRALIKERTLNFQHNKFTCKEVIK